MPEIPDDLTSFERADAELNGLLISYWPTVHKFACDICGESVANYVRITKGVTDSKVVRCCVACSKSAIKRLSQ